MSVQSTNDDPLKYHKHSVPYFSPSEAKKNKKYTDRSGVWKY